MDGKGLRKNLMFVIMTFVMILGTLIVIPNKVEAGDYTNAGCVAWAKDRAKEKLGIDLPSTGNKPSGVYGASNWWDVLPNYGYKTGSEPASNSLAIWRYTVGAYSNYGHVAYVENVSGDSITVSEGGCKGYSYNGHTGVICRTVSKSEMSSLGGCSGFLGYVYLGGTTPPTPITSRRIYADGITSTNAVLHWDLDDTPYMGSVGIWIAKSNEAYAGKWVEFTPNSNTNKVSVDVNAECGRTLEPNTTYKYKFYYYVQNNCTWSDEGTFTTALGSSTPTTSRIIYVDNITETNALIHWDLSDTPYMGTVGIWIAKANETYTGKWVEFAPYSNTNKVSVDVNAECGRTLEKGTKYKYIFYYYVGSNCTWSNEGTFVTKGDSTKPVITDAEVINLDSNGYTVRCRATDNVGIDRVQCPTWTANNDQDDIAKDWWTNTSVKATLVGNNVYEFKVRRSDHNNEYGIYHTHIYAYDFAGNSINVALNNNDVQEEHTHSYTSEVTKEPTCTETGVRTFSCTCGDTYTEEIPAKGHTYSEKVVSPTYTEDGYTLYTCDSCGDSYRDNIVEKFSQSENITLSAQVSEDKIKFTWNAPDKNATYGIVYALYEEELDAVEANNLYEVSGLKANNDTLTYECSNAIYKEQPGGVWFRVVMTNGNVVKHSNAVNITDWRVNDSKNDPIDKSDSGSGVVPSTQNTENSDSSTTSTVSDSSNAEKITLGALTITQVTPSINKVTFKWDSISNATGYIIEYSVNADLSSVQTACWDKNNLVSYILTDLQDNTTYYYRVRAYKGVSEDREYSEWTSVASVKTKEKTVITEAPSQKTYSVPKIKLKSVKNNKKKTVTIKWKYNSSVDGYQVAVANKKSFANAKKKNLKSYYDSIIVKGLSKGKTYYVRIRAYVKDDYGNKVYGKWSAVKKVKIKK